MTETPSGRFSAHFPYQQRRQVAVEELAIREVFARETVDVAALEQPAVPEPPRFGEGGVDCRGCTEPDDAFLWADDHWRIRTGPRPRAVFFVQLMPRAHYQDLPDLPAERAAEFGPLLQRMERALVSLGDVGRVHTHRWGDGGAHLHIWQLIRPAGMVQANGVSLPVWLGALPAMPAQTWDDACVDFAKTMAASGGTAYR